jgi:NifU-like protein involved in Fe-S cluster formation
MEYSSEVRRRLRNPRWAGTLSGCGTGLKSGEAEDRSLNVWVRFRVELDRDTIRTARFGAYGCPHFVAAADWIAEHIEGKPTAILRESHALAIGKALDVPTEKLGKLLVLEDALEACAAASAATVFEASGQGINRD